MLKWWKSQIRIIGRETYIRFYPNPGFRIVHKGIEYRWNVFYGWRRGGVR